MRRCRPWYRIHQLLHTRLPLPPGPLVVLHGSGHEHPWILLTDTPPDRTEVTLHACRDWIEQGFRGPGAPAGNGSARAAPIPCAQGGTGWRVPWPAAWPRHAPGGSRCPRPQPRTAAVAPDRPASCARAWPAWGPCWPRGAGGGRGVWLRPRPGPYGRGRPRPGPGTLTHSPASGTRSLGHRHRGQTGASFTPSPTGRTAIRAACEPAQPPRNTRTAGERHSDPPPIPPHPVPHIYLSRW